MGFQDRSACEVWSQWLHFYGDSSDYGDLSVVASSQPQGKQCERNLGERITD